MQTWQYTAEQEAAMASANSTFEGGQPRLFGKLMMLIQQLFKLGMTAPRERGAENMPRDRALVPVRSDGTPDRK